MTAAEPVGRHRRDDPDRVDALADLLDDFTDYVGSAETGLKRAGHYRASLLWVHALAAMAIAPLIVATGLEGLIGPAFTLIKQLPGSPTSLAAIIGTGGFVLGAGAIMASRPVQVAGLLLLALFYLILAASFTGAVVLYLDGTLDAKPTFYLPVVYLHLNIIMLVHMWHVARRGRGGARDDGHSL